MIKLIQQIYGIYPNPHTGVFRVSQFLYHLSFMIYHLAQRKAFSSV